MRDRRTLAVAGAAIVAIVAIVAVLLTSVARVPEFATLDDDPQTGTVAFFSAGQDDSRQSLTLVDLATAESSTVPLSFESELLGWDDDGNLMVVEWSPSTERMLVIDPVTGETVRSSIPIDAERESLRGEWIWTDARDGRIAFVREVDTVVASFAAPSSYDVPSASLMGDDRVVFTDELGRVGVMPAREDAVPVLVADGALPLGAGSGKAVACAGEGRLQVDDGAGPSSA